MRPPVVGREQTRINVDTAVEQRIANTNVTFTLIDAQGLITPDDKLRWHFGDISSFQEAGLQTSHLYRTPGRYEVKVEVMRDDTPFKILQEIITILPGQIEINRAQVMDRLRRNQRLLSVFALIIAVITGLLLLYVNKPFGSISDYLLAILWGFGIDSGVKSVADVFSKLRVTGGTA